jgi:hypothetical protein
MKSQAAHLFAFATAIALGFSPVPQSNFIHCLSAAKIYSIESPCGTTASTIGSCSECD